MRSTQPERGSVVLHTDETPTSHVLGFFERFYDGRLYNPLDDPEASKRLQEQRQAWAEQANTTVVFTSGVFDVFHPSHRAYLLATRMAALPIHNKRFYGDNWAELSDKERMEFAEHALGEGELKQVVSVDGDAAVAVRKGFKPDKANMPRPIYSWQTRARDVLHASVGLPGDVKGLFLADAVTIHDNVEPTLQGTPHQDIMDIAHYVKPDVWSVYAESEDITGALHRDRLNGNRYSGIQPVVLATEGLCGDELLGGTFSTTALAQRIGGVGMIETVA